MKKVQVRNTATFPACRIPPGEVGEVDEGVLAHADYLVRVERAERVEPRAPTAPSAAPTQGLPETQPPPPPPAPPETERAEPKRRGR